MYVRYSQRPSIVLVAMLAVCLAACESGESVRIVNLGGTTAANTPGEQMWLSFKRDAELASGGALELRPLIYGQLGSEEQLLSGIRRGRIQFANLSAQVTSTVVPELSLLYAPFLFDSETEADYVYDNYLTDLFSDMLAAEGMHLVTWYEIGFHSVYGKEPIILPADARGKRFRVSSSLHARLFAAGIGADVFPLGYGEVVSSLQTGLVEAGENSISLYARTGISSEAPHLTLTRHAFGVSVIVSNLRWWQSLSQTERDILTDTFPSIDESRREIRAQDLKDLSDPELGIVVHALTGEQRQKWKQVTASIPDTLIESIGGRSAEILDIIEQGKAEFAQLKVVDGS